MIYVLKLFWDRLLGLLFICLTNLQVIIFLNFKEKKSESNFGQFKDISINNLNELDSTSTVSSLIFPTSQNSSKTTSEPSSRGSPWLFIDQFLDNEIVESQSCNNAPNFKVFTKPIEQRSLSSTCKLNKHLKTENPKLLFGNEIGKIRLNINRQSVNSLSRTTQESFDSELSDNKCKQCKNEIFDTVHKAHYRYRDSAVCAKCYMSINKDIKSS